MELDFWKEHNIPLCPKPVSRVNWYEYATRTLNDKQCSCGKGGWHVIIKEEKMCILNFVGDKILVSGQRCLGYLFAYTHRYMLIT